MTSLTFSEYGEGSEMMQLTEGDCPRGRINELPHITKIHCSTENMKIWKNRLSVKNLNSDISRESPYELLRSQLPVLYFWER